jgi:hypothetical protein
MKTVKSESELSDLGSVDLTTATDVSVTDDEEGDMSSSSSRRMVSFGPIHVREYERIVGDHPDTRIGVPLSIGWAFYERKPVSIEQYEADRVQKGHNLRMNSITRKNLLHNEFGVPEEELRNAEKEIQKIKKQRMQSAKQIHASEKTEGALKGIGKKIRRGSWTLLKGMSSAAQSGLMMSAGSFPQSQFY